MGLVWLCLAMVAVGMAIGAVSVLAIELVLVGIGAAKLQRGIEAERDVARGFAPSRFAKSDAQALHSRFD